MARFPVRSQARPSDPAHEARCRRCGVSCHLALPIGAQNVVIPGLHCRFLAEIAGGSFVCTVYEQRFEKAPWCHHANEAAPLGMLARDCSYAIEASAKKGKIRLREPLLSRYWPHLLAAVIREGVPRHVDQERFLAEVQRREGRRWQLIDPGPERNRLLLQPAEDEDPSPPCPGHA